MIRQCPKCQAKNRVPAHKLAAAATCGRCKAEMGPQSAPVDVTAGSFEQIVRDADVPVLVDFWAPWCGPCKMAAPEVKKVAKSQAGKALVLKVNTDQAPALMRRYQIRSIPTFMVFRGGKPVAQQAGLRDAAALERMLRR